MTHFSALDIKRVEETLTPSTCYTPTKNRTSFELFLKGKKNRAEITEGLIAQWIKYELGFNAKVTTGKGKGGGAGQSPHDVEYDIKDSRYKRGYKKVRIECKSALAGKLDWEKWNKLYFCYQGVKPNNFDYIFFFEVNPNDGLIVKWTTRKEVMNFVSKKGLKNNARKGYAINIRNLRKEKGIKLYDLDDFPHES